MCKKAVSFILSLCFIISLNATTFASEGIPDTVIKIDLADGAVTADIVLDELNEINNSFADDTSKIVSITELLFRCKLDQIVNKNDPDLDLSVFWDPNSKNTDDLNYFSRDILAKKRTLIALQTDYYDASSNLSINNSIIGSENAKLNVYEWMEYRDTSVDSDIPSGVGIDYAIYFIKTDGCWLITDIVFDDEATDMLKNPEISVDELVELRNYQPAVNEGEVLAGAENSVNALSGYYTSLDVDRTTNYAINYSRNDEYSTTYYNSNFPSYSSDCQNFASQCIWYGLGGTDDYAHIHNKYWPMKSSGSYPWYANESSHSSSWTVCDYFADLISNVSSSREGPHGTIYSGISKARSGDIIQFDEEGDGEYEHSFVVVAVTGTYGSRTSSNIVVCAHTRNRNNYNLSQCYVSSYTYRTIHITYDWRQSDPNPTQ